MKPAERDSRIQLVCLLVLATIAVAFGLYWLAPVLIPFVLALFFTSGLTPLLRLQTDRLRMPHALAVFTTFGLGFVLLYLLATLVAASVAQLSENASSYQQQITRLWDAGIELIPFQRFGIDPDQIASELPLEPGKIVGSTLIRLSRALVDLMSRGLIVLVFLFFLLSGRRRRDTEGGVWSEVSVRIQRYIVIKSIISAATGVIVGSILAVLGVDLALVFGLLTFLLNFIPSIGSIVATLLPLPVVIFNPALSPTTAVLAIVLPGAVQLVIGNLVDPKVMGESLDLNPITIVLFLIFWGMIWGIVGMLLAAPIAAILRLLLERLEITAPVAHLMAGERPAPD